MTREEAIALFEKQLTAAQVVLDSGFGSNPGENDFLYRRRKDMAEIALAALRPVGQERVERVWKSEWVDNGERDSNGVPKTFAISCKRCGSSAGTIWMNFCPHCGAPMTDEAVEIRLKEFEALKDG